MGKVILSAFADEFSADIDIQIKMLSENGIGYIARLFSTEGPCVIYKAEHARNTDYRPDYVSRSNVRRPCKLKAKFVAYHKTVKRRCGDCEHLKEIAEFRIAGKILFKPDTRFTEIFKHLEYHPKRVIDRKRNSEGEHNAVSDRVSL